jgi:chromosome segregation ATPase
VKKELMAAQAESKAKSQTIEDMKALAAKEASEEERLRKQLSQANADLNALELAKNKLMEEFKKADAEAAKKYEKEAKDHFADHTALEKQGKLLDAEREAKKAAQNELVNVKTKLRTANIEIEAKNKTISGLRSELVGLRTQVEDSKKKNNELQVRLTETTTKLTGSEQSLADAKKVIATLGVEALAAKEHIHKIDQELKDANATIISVKDQVQILATERDAATATVAKTQTSLETATKEITGLKTDLHTVKTAAEGLSSMLKEEEAKLKAAQETFKAELKIKHDAYMAVAADRDIADSKKKEAIAKQMEAVNELLQEEAKHQTERLAYIKSSSITPEQMAANEAKTKELEAALAAAKARLIPTPDPKNINILSVEYGGRSYPRDSNVVKTLHSYAKTGAEFRVENKIFDEGDPWRGWKKTFSITYQLAEGGVPIHLVGHENDMVKFKLSRN